MIHIGPAGNSERFYEEGHKKTEQAPAWLSGMGLNAMEYSAGHGVSMSEETARAIGAQAREHGIRMSIHAPYYINCAFEEPDKRANTLNHFLRAAQAIDWMGGDRAVFHIGSPGKAPRHEATRRANRTVLDARRMLMENGFSHIHLCPETMGRAGQLGTLDEVLNLCLMDESFVPTLDFGHLHTIGLGALNTADDFRRVLDKLISALGIERARTFHAHFSKIEYNAKGERMHKRFSDEGYGPDFALLAPLIVEYGLAPTLICESKGTQADDARQMRQMLIESGALM